MSSIYIQLLWLPDSITGSTVAPSTLYLTEPGHNLLLPCQTTSWDILATGMYTEESFIIVRKIVGG